MQTFCYVGPDSIREQVAGQPGGLEIATQTDLKRWAESDAVQAEDGWCTYVVSAEGCLLVASRRTEHVACAEGKSVRCAGELRATTKGEVVEISNNSTGYCPAEDTWDSVRSALDEAIIEHPGGFTFTAVFRKCEACGARNLVKDGWLECAMCGAQLPEAWNF